MKRLSNKKYRVQEIFEAITIISAVSIIVALFCMAVMR